MRLDRIIRNGLGISTNDECRKYFEECGLSYDKVKEDDIQVLYMKCVKYVKEANKYGSMSVESMRMSKKVTTKYRTNGSIIEAFLFLNSHYFTQREAISFNHDGFIGFAGWADSGNMQPLIDAFIDWCNFMKDDSNEV